LNQAILSEPEKAEAAAAYVAKRLDKLAEEGESGWTGHFLPATGFRFEREVRGVREIATIDPALLDSADARKLDQYAPKLQPIYAHPPTFVRKEETTVIQGPRDLFRVVTGVG